MSLRWKKLCVYLIAAIWLPLSTFSHAHLTAMLAQSIGGMSHPALAMAHEAHAQLDGASEPIYVVVDAALFWDTVDQYEGECKLSAFCASLASAVPMPGAVTQLPMLANTEPHPVNLTHSSRATAPDTPPPRPHL